MFTFSTNIPESNTLDDAYQYPFYSVVLPTTSTLPSIFGYDGRIMEHKLDFPSNAWQIWLIPNYFHRYVHHGLLKLFFRNEIRFYCYLAWINKLMLAGCMYSLGMCKGFFNMFRFLSFIFFSNIFPLRKSAMCFFNRANQKHIGTRYWNVSKWNITSRKSVTIKQKFH